jgi:protein TonB
MHSQHVLFLEESQHATSAKQHLILPPPAVGPLQDVFAEAMLEDNSAHQRRSPLDWAVSLAVHVAILAVLLILPLYFTAGLDVHKFNLTFLASPPAGPPPAPLISTAVSRVVRSVPARAYTPGKLTAPAFIPRVVAPTPSEPGDAAPPDIAGVPGGVPGGMPGGQLGGVIGGVLGGEMRSVPVPAAPLAPSAGGPKKPVRVGGAVKPPLLIYGPDPEYPTLAKRAHISGVVVIEAVIDEHGNVTGMRAIGGQPLLIPAALSAVSKRKYQPTILDGEPTPIDLRVEITFSVV